MTELSGPGGTPSPGSAQGPMYEHFHLNLPNNLRSPKGVLEGLKASHKRDVHAKIAYNTLALCAGTVFGVFSALALTGIMVNPVGLAVSGSLIALALAIAGGHGGMKEVLSASRIALAGFAAGAAVVLSRFTMKFHTFGGYDPAILLSSFLLVGGLASFSSGIYGATVPPPSS